MAANSYYTQTTTNCPHSAATLHRVTLDCLTIANTCTYVYRLYLTDADSVSNGMAGSANRCSETKNPHVFQSWVHTFHRLK